MVVQLYWRFDGKVDRGGTERPARHPTERGLHLEDEGLEEGGGEWRRKRGGGIQLRKEAHGKKMGGEEEEAGTN